MIKNIVTRAGFYPYNYFFIIFSKKTEPLSLSLSFSQSPPLPLMFWLFLSASLWIYHFISVLALNNQLYTSHISIKRALIELCLQALLSDIKEQNQVSRSYHQWKREF